MSESTRVLVLEDDPAMAEFVADELGRRGYQCATAASPAQAEEHLAEAPVDVIVTDVRLGHDDGIDFVERLRDRGALSGDSPTGVVVVTGFGSMETAVRALRAGAVDYLAKPFDTDQLVLSIERVLESRRLRGEVKRLRHEIRRQEATQSLVVASPAMKAISEMVSRIADAEATVLVTGPSGSGKEVVARSLHERSRRAEGPFIAVNCAALPEQLLESELFGYRKGAFTDARTHRDGLFKAAHGGTLFLDEIGEMPLSIQPKLLRVLQHREVTPIGATRPERVDVRLVAATNQRVETLVREKRFREDLYYRLNVIRLEIPPLRERREDIVPLARTFLDRLAARTGRRLDLADDARAAMLAHAWPGNVRELENALERAVALATSSLLQAIDLPAEVTVPHEGMVVEGAIQRRLTLDALSNEYCAAVVRHYGGNQSAAARHLDIDRKTLAKRLGQVLEPEPEGRPGT